MRTCGRGLTLNVVVSLRVSLHPAPARQIPPDHNLVTNARTGTPCSCTPGPAPAGLLHQSPEPQRVPFVRRWPEAFRGARIIKDTRAISRHAQRTGSRSIPGGSAAGMVVLTARAGDRKLRQFVHSCGAPQAGGES